MKLDKGTVMWQVPIRYWETTEPIKVTVMEDFQEEVDHNYHKFNLYVYDEEYGHNVYVNPMNCFIERDNAIKTAQEKAKLYEIRNDDDAERVMRHLEKDHPEKFKKARKSRPRSPRGKGWHRSH